MFEQNTSVGFKTQKITDSITRPSNTTAYAAGDVISEVTNNDHHTFSDMSRHVNYGKDTGTILSARLISSVAGSPNLDGELWLFHTDIAEVADNSAAAVTDAEMLTLIGIIDFPAGQWKTAGANAVCSVDGLNIPYKTDATAKVYGQLIARNAYTPASAEVITVDLWVSKD